MANEPLYRMDDDQEARRKFRIGKRYYVPAEGPQNFNAMVEVVDFINVADTTEMVKRFPLSRLVPLDY